MRRTALALVVCSALALQPFALADGGNPTTEPTACKAAKDIYALSHWRERHPARGESICENSPRRIRKLKERFHEYRLYRRIAPFRGPNGHGPRSPADGRWWAIPWPIVCGESGGNFYVNQDGAYQIIPSTWRAFGGGRFAPVAGAATELEQHIIAAAAWGKTPWYGLC